MITNKQREALKLGRGHAQSTEARKHISDSLKGRKPTEKQLLVLEKGRKNRDTQWKPQSKKKASISAINSPLKKRNEQHWAWKGDKAGYRSIHRWVVRNLGRPNQCSKCKKIVLGKGIHWANINHKYKRNLKDWIRLCVKCHRAFDKNKRK